ncbi:hypothetical protein E8E13_003014 [Curvularia kusanoi]|uniref:Helicase C-terminal domain-containing protein n=1 Tax=Curvularia kusanoi TaxID=90978 RepID=A0A9P4T5Z2_CURKU|nr:hypothetical protein E8E13_003014 [Curvularia kusanoi]
MNGTKPCRLLPLATSIRTPPLSPARDISPSIGDAADESVSTDVKISSKVRALVQQIKSCPTEKHVVFSSWTSSLDMVERGLAAVPVASVRIDGSVTPVNRAHAIDQLRSNPNVRVILLTISCGACGLDLTAASVVHLLEPQWNPSLEDQALARVHRLGQTRPVTTFRYIMRDSFEEHMLKVQDRKKLLTTMLLSDNAAIQSLQDMLSDNQG